MKHSLDSCEFILVIKYHYISLLLNNFRLLIFELVPTEERARHGEKYISRSLSAF